MDKSILQGASISPDGVYRYKLWRIWGSGRRVNFVLLNPSTADAEKDDPTVRRCMGFARSWGYETVVVTNLFAFRSTDPGLLTSTGLDPVGLLNDQYILNVARQCSLVVCAWGTGGCIRGRGREVRGLLQRAGFQLHVLKLTKHGDPSHPLYLKGDLKPVPWSEDT